MILEEKANAIVTLLPIIKFLSLKIAIMKREGVAQNINLERVPTAFKC